MRIGEICTRDVVHVPAETSVTEAARRMRTDHVGDVLIVESGLGKLFPRGIVTDRDIVVEVVAAKIDPATVTVGEVMNGALATANEAEQVSDVLPRMRYEGVRRMPVVDADGALVGMVTLDDLLEVIAQELTDTVRLMTWGRVREERVRDLPLPA